MSQVHPDGILVKSEVICTCCLPNSLPKRQFQICTYADIVFLKWWLLNMWHQYVHMQRILCPRRLMWIHYLTHKLLILPTDGGARWLRVDAAALYFLWFHNPLMLTDEYFHRQHNTLFHVRWATTSCFFLTNCTEISEEHQETPNFLFLVISIHLENLCLLSLTLHQFSILSDFLLFVTFDIYH